MMDDIYRDLSVLRRTLGHESLLMFGKLYLREHMAIEPSAAHREIYDILSDISRKRGGKVAIAAPREFGKSTMITLMYVLYCICYDLEKFILILSGTADQAIQLLHRL